MSSPRGFVLGGIGDKGCGVGEVEGSDDVEGGRLRLTVVDWAGGEVGDGDRGKKNPSGLNGILEVRGGFRTFRYMLNDRSALLACGTY